MILASSAGVQEWNSRSRKSEQEHAGFSHARFGASGYAGAGPGGRKTPYSAAEFHDSVRRGRPFVAVGEGEIVGAVVFLGPDAEGRAIAGQGEAELSRLAVTAAARDRGTGRALSELCTALARETGAEGVALWSRPYQVAAHRLYESLGYRRSPERDDDDADARRLVFRLGL